MSKTKTTDFYFKCSPEEMTYIECGMKQLGTKNRSAYLRKMAIDGHVFVVDYTALNEIGRLRSTVRASSETSKFRASQFVRFPT